MVRRLLYFYLYLQPGRNAEIRSLGDARAGGKGGGTKYNKRSTPTVEIDVGGVEYVSRGTKYQREGIEVRRRMRRLRYGEAPQQAGNEERRGERERGGGICVCVGSRSVSRSRQDHDGSPQATNTQIEHVIFPQLLHRIAVHMCHALMRVHVYVRWAWDSSAASVVHSRRGCHAVGWIGGVVFGFG